MEAGSSRSSGRVHGLKWANSATMPCSRQCLAKRAANRGPLAPRSGSGPDPKGPVDSGGKLAQKARASPEGNGPSERKKIRVRWPAERRVERNNVTAPRKLVLKVRTAAEGLGDLERSLVESRLFRDSTRVVDGMSIVRGYRWMPSARQQQ